MWRDSKTLFHNAIPHISLSIEIVFVETGTNIFAEVTVTGCLFVALFSDRMFLAPNGQCADWKWHESLEVRCYSPPTRKDTLLDDRQAMRVLLQLCSVCLLSCMNTS